MSNISMISAWGQAEDYNSSCCNNGGSYYQPQGGVLYRVGDQLVTVDVDDTSCGDFGIRVWATISTDSHKWAICYGSMDDAAIMEDAEIAAVMRSISGVLRIDDPWYDFVLAAVNAVRYMGRVYLNAPRAVTSGSGCMVSLDNGYSYVTADEAIAIIDSDATLIDWDTIVNLMDDDIRERVAYELAPCSNADFLRRYLELSPDNLVIG